jgi:hypothetical protein
MSTTAFCNSLCLKRYARATLPRRDRNSLLLVNSVRLSGRSTPLSLTKITVVGAWPARDEAPDSASSPSWCQHAQNSSALLDAISTILVGKQPCNLAQLLAARPS